MTTILFRKRVAIPSITSGVVNNNGRAVLCTLFNNNSNNNNSSNMNTSNSSLSYSSALSSYHQQSLLSLQYHNHFRCHFSGFSRTTKVMEQMTMKVPTMGDSITEGTIVEWTTAIGEAVNEGDVICLVETDKVTVDIKAEVDGVIVAQYGAVDDTIEVGANLYQIDTTATATVTNATPVQSDVPPSPPSPSTPHERKPSLTFLGKEGWAARLAAGVSQTSKQQQQQQQTFLQYVDDLDPMYGRPPVTTREMEALMLGGANLTD